MKTLLIALALGAAFSASAQTINLSPQTQTFGYQEWKLTVTPGAQAPVTRLVPFPDRPPLMLPPEGNRNWLVIKAGAGNQPALQTDKQAWDEEKARLELIFQAANIPVQPQRSK